MYSLLKYLKHLITAGNQHGVHSPFVYNYVTKCLYTGQEYSKEKAVNVLLKSISYFKITAVSLSPEKQILRTKILQEFKHIKIDEPPFDLISSDVSEENGMRKIVAEIDKTSNNSVLIVDNIHSTSKSSKNWNYLKNLDKITVTIDLYYCGVVFLRTEQAKEHFKIRI